MMRSLLWMSLALSAIAGLSASPAYAQFAAEDSASAEYPASAYGAEPAPTPVADTDYGYDQAAAAPDPYATDPYVADPAYGAAPAQPIADRTVGDLANSVLGAKGAQHAQDAEAVVREVIGKRGVSGGSPSTPSASDAVSLVRDVLGVVRKQKDPQ